MAKHTKVKWTCPDCGSVNETMCNGSVTATVESDRLRKEKQTGED